MTPNSVRKTSQKVVLLRPNRSTDIADRLKGKVALVVGAGSIGPGWGNGKATAVAFARDR